MSILRKLAHLQEQLGEGRFEALIDSGNTGKVKAFCDELVASALPTEMTIGGITYDILGFLREGETLTGGDVMVGRAKEVNANLGREDCDHLLKHQDEIPAILRGRVVFVFTDYRRPDGRESVAYVVWRGARWIQRWSWLGFDLSDFFARLLRRK